MEMGKPQIRDGVGDDDTFVDELKPGTKLMHGQYTIERFLNAGGFGITYLATDSLDRKVVIKECFPGAFCRRSRYVVQARSRAHQNELKSIVRLFVQEARSLAKLDHPNIVGVHQVFEDNETAYMALDYVDGRDMLDIIEDPNEGLTPAQTKSILRDVLGAVGFIHDQSILHRDISPDNILINSDFNPVLIDFGAAREEATKQSRVLSALRVVKDGYSPQEFYIAGSEQSPSSDLYALAASFHHLIADEVPPNSQARLAAIASGEPDPYAPLLGRFDDYDDAFLASLDKALAVLPKDRVQSAQHWLSLMDGEDGNVTPLNLAGAAIVGADKDDSAVAAAAVASGGSSKMPFFLGTAAVIALIAGGGYYLYSSGNLTIAGTQEVAEPAATQSEALVANSGTAVETAVEEPVESTTAAENSPAATAPAKQDANGDEATVAETAPTPVEEAPATTETAATEAQVEEEAVAQEGEPLVESDVAVATIEDPVTAPETTETVVEAPETPTVEAPLGTAIADVAANDAASAVDDETSEVAAAPIVEEPAPVVEELASTPTPTAEENERPSGGASIGEIGAVIAGPGISARPTPVLDGGAEPQEVAIAAVPAFDEPAPLPEPAATPRPAVNEPEVAGELSGVDNSSLIAAGAPTNLSLPTTPGAATDVLGAQIAQIVAVVPGNELLPPLIDRSWSVQLPFSAARPGSNVIGNVAFISPVWVRSGLEITSVNGVEVGAIDDISDIVAATSEVSDAPQIEVVFGTLDTTTGEARNESWSVPVAQETALENGLRFQTDYTGSAWRTIVIDVPDSLLGAFEVGDVVLADLKTRRPVDGRDTLAELIETELANGGGQFAFEVQRGEDRWVAPFVYTGSEG